MRPPADPGARTLTVIAAITPFALVFALRETGAVPRPEASAAPQTPASAPIVAPPPPAAPTPRQTRAMEWIRAHQSYPALPDPMARPPAPAPSPAPAEPRATPTIVVAPQHAPDAPPLPAWTVSGLMGQGPEAVAVINDRVVRIGDDVGSGWTLLVVDARARTATLRHPDGREAELTQVPPTPR